MMIKQQRRCVRVLAGFVSLALFATQVAFAHVPQQSVWDTRRAAQERAEKSTQIAHAALSAPAAISSLVVSAPVLADRPSTHPDYLTAVPMDAVTIRRVVPAGKSGPLAGRRVIIVQDVHMNREAQGHVAKLLLSLMDARRAGLVAVEGAFGRFDLDRFRRFPDGAATRAAAQAFFDTDRMGGPSFAGLTTTAQPPLFHGIDDAAHYDANVAAYLRSTDVRERAGEKLASEAREIEERKKSAFPTALAALDAAAAAYARGERGLGEHLEVLDRVGAADAAVLQRFLEASRLERRIDFARADAERRAALEKLVARLGKAEIDGIVALSLSYRAGAVSYGDYHRRISALFDRHGVSLDGLPSFQSYLRYVALSDAIDGDRLLDAAARATALALDRAAVTPEQKDLVRLSRRLELKRKLLDFSLIPGEWEEYAAGGFDAGLSDFEDFYREAHVRSEKMVENFAALALRSDAARPAVLVIGGFHAPEMAARLTSLGAGYALVSPRLSKVDTASGSAYLSVFSREKTPLDRLFAGEKLFVYPAHVNVSAPGKYTEEPNRELAGLQRSIGKPERSGGLRRTLTAAAAFLLAWFVSPDAAVASQPDQDSRRPSQSTADQAGTDSDSPGSKNAAAKRVPSEVLKQSIYEHSPEVAGKTIVEVTMEMALSGEAFKAMTAAGIDHETQVNAAMATSTGGIGPLLKERIIELGRLGADAIGISLLYEHVWVQRVQKDPNGGPDRMVQEKVKIGDAFRKILEPAGEISLEMHDGSTARIKVWRAPAGMYGKSTVYFLDHIPTGSNDPRITDVVYPGNADASGMSEAMRLSQNWMVGRGSLALLKQLNRQPDVTVMSEMPTTLSMHKLVEDRYTNDPFFAKTHYVFNDHTPLEYAHPKWDAGVRQRMRLRPRFYENQNLWVHDKNGQRTDLVDGTAMIINAADAVYGVAKKHGHVMRAMPLLRQFAEKIQSITNGVSQWYWPADEFKDPKKVAKMTDGEIGAVKTRRRDELFDWLEKRQGMPAGWAERMKAAGMSIGIWTRRLVSYKRVDLFAEMLENEESLKRFLKSKIVFVVGGRIHQDDDFGLRQFARIQAVLSDPQTAIKYPELRDRVIFFDNYNILEAPKLFQGADFSVMLADDGREASATGFQKIQMNGGLVIASHDGATPESVWDVYEDPENSNGFKVPYVEVVPGEPMSPTSEGLLTAFERFASARANPSLYNRMVRNALNAAPRVDVLRTAVDMLDFFTGMIVARRKVNDAYQNGRSAAIARIDQAALSSGDAAAALAALNSASHFGWRYRENGVSERDLHVNGAGVEGFLAGHDYVREIGTVGDWSLAFHAYNSGGRGDVVAYLQDAFARSPELATVAEYLADLAEESIAADSIEEKVQIQRVAIGFAEKVVDELKEAAGLRTDRAVPGLVGAWAAATNLTFTQMTDRESAAIGVALLAAIAAGLYLFAPAASLIPTVGAGVAVSSLLALGASAIVLGVIVVAHAVLGVLQRDRTVARSESAIAEASLRAASTLLSAPLVALGAVLVYASHADPFTGAALIAAGLLVGFAAHRIANRKFIASSLLNKSERADAIRVGRLFAELRDARRQNDGERVATLLSRIVPLEDLDVDAFGREAALAEWRYFSTFGQRGTAGGFIAADTRRKDSLAMVAAGETAEQIAAEARQALRLAEGRPLSLIIPSLQAATEEESALLTEALANEVRALVSGVQVLTEPTLSVVDDLLEPALRNGGKLKLLVQREAGLPDFLVKALAGLEDDDRFRDLVEFVIVAALSSGALAVRATLSDVEKAIEYRQLVLSQA